MSSKNLKRVLFGLAWLGVFLALVGCSSGGADTESEEFSLTDVVWQWESVTVQPSGETTTVPDPENYTIIFRDDDAFSGQADCNEISGTYSQEGGFFITLGPSTMAFCGEDSLDQQYVELLGKIVAGGHDGAGGLALETTGGGERMKFRNGGSAPAQ